MKGRANMEEYRKFEAQLQERLEKVKINSETLVGEVFNDGLNTMLHIACSEFLWLKGEKKDD